MHKLIEIALLLINIYSVVIINNNGLARVQARESLNDSLNDITPLTLKFCPKAVHCKNCKKYRTISGKCNNLQHSNWGQSYTPFIRLLPQNYSDSISTFRESVEGGPLPTARCISNKLALKGEETFTNLTVIFMQWGQLVTHDITFAATPRDINCCQRSPDGTLIKNDKCEPIICESDDPFYSKFNQTCLNFKRDYAAPTLKCNLDYREQINEVTNYMDASFVYGSTKEIMKSLRSYKNGELLVIDLNGREFFPYNNPKKCVFLLNPKADCVLAGDLRVNQQIGITLLQLLFLREHNRIARILQSLNPGWKDETIFQETRRIIVAEMQYITYNEWLPFALGPSFMEKYDLYLEPSGYSYKYDCNINPGISNEFAGAGFRWHSLVQGFYNLMDSNGIVLRQLQMRDVFEDPSHLYPKNRINQCLYGLTEQKSQSLDNIFSEDITNFFHGTSTTLGTDLISIDIQRGRDHGLPTYNDIREYCGLPRVKNFKELNEVLLPGSAQIFAETYKNVNDIDFVIAGQHENNREVGVLACITAEQFHRTKTGDRFWFENGNMYHSFTEEQLDEIRKVTLASLLCQNGDDISVMQAMAFVSPNDKNPRQNCSLIPKMNLQYWKYENN